MGVRYKDEPRGVYGMGHRETPGRFRIANRTDSQLSFSQNLDGDTEAIAAHLVPSGDNLHVRVEVVVSPD